MNYFLVGVCASILLLGCFENKAKKNTSDIGQSTETTSLNNNIHFVLEKNNNSQSWLDIITLNESNNLIFQTRRDKWILSSSGYGNTELLVDKFGKATIDTIDFRRDGIKEYLFQSFIKGSTYGASFNYIVYKNNEWEVLRLPFERSVVRYEESLNDYVIVEYSNGDSSFYSFSKGILTHF